MLFRMKGLVVCFKLGVSSSVLNGKQSLRLGYLFQEGPVQRNSTCFTSSIQAFRLADENKRFDSPLVVVSPWPSNINKSARLVAIFQIFPGFDVMQRVVVPESFWMTYGLDKASLYEAHERHLFPETRSQFHRFESLHKCFKDLLRTSLLD